jgi:hypothetical protein
MLTILGIKLSYETLVFLGLFLGSELIGASKLRDNSVVQLILSGINALKPLRREDDQINKIKQIFKD